MSPDPAELPPLENILVATLYLATNFVKSGCPRMSHLLLHQLDFVVKHPRADVSPMVTETCRKLQEVWEAIHAERTLAAANEEAPSIIRNVH